MIAIVSFGASLLGIVSILLFKQWEAGREFTYYSQYRTKADYFVLRMGNVARIIPLHARVLFSRVGHAIVFYISNFVLHVVRFIERKLFKFVNMVKGRREVHHKKGSASLFLNSISDTKGRSHEGE